MKSRLVPEDLGVCARLREIRDWLGVSQKAFAEQAGLKRERLASYENQRVAVPCEVGLRICRTWIVSEEWLATGKVDAFRATYRNKYPNSKGDLSSLNSIAMRQCVDLLHEPESRRVPPEMGFEEAFRTILSKRYQELVSEFFYSPRVAVQPTDQPELLANYFMSLVERWLKMIDSEARGQSVDPFTAQRIFARSLVETGGFLFSRALRGSAAPPEFLRVLVTDPTSAIGLSTEGHQARSEPEVPTVEAAIMN